MRISIIYKEFEQEARKCRLHIMKCILSTIYTGYVYPFHHIIVVKHNKQKGILNSQNNLTNYIYDPNIDITHDQRWRRSVYRFGCKIIFTMGSLSRNHWQRKKMLELSMLGVFPSLKNTIKHKIRLQYYNSNSWTEVHGLTRMLLLETTWWYMAVFPYWKYKMKDNESVTYWSYTIEVEWLFLILSLNNIKTT